MAHGNMFLGYARGSVGDVTFSRSNGAQIARARNRRPSNPRSEAQMTQRALFANSVKFYKMAVSQFFKFAFENKTQNLSDFNAFMHVNLKRGVLISKSALDTATYPALGNWVLSQGSLRELVADTTQSESPFYSFAEGSDIEVPVPDERTVGWLSSLLVSLNPSEWRMGDIVTFVVTTSSSSDVPSASPAKTGLAYSFVWKQFILNADDTRRLVDIVSPLFRVNVVNDNKNIGFSYGANSQSADEEFNNGLTACTVIHSRNTSGGLQVSDSELFGNSNYNVAIMRAQNASYISAVLADWDASQKAILQGVAASDGSDVPALIPAPLPFGVVAYGKNQGSISESHDDHNPDFVLDNYYPNMGGVKEFQAEFLTVSPYTPTLYNIGDFSIDIATTWDGMEIVGIERGVSGIVLSLKSGTALPPWPQKVVINYKGAKIMSITIPA